MIIYPDSHQAVTVEDAIEGLNKAPQPGDPGHVDDHERITKVLFDVPQTRVPMGYALRDGGAWMLSTSTDPEPSSMPAATFEQVRAHAERVGIVCIAGDPNDAADGVTDWTEDSEALEGVWIQFFASGVFGLSHAVADLIQRVGALKAAQA